MKINDDKSNWTCNKATVFVENIINEVDCMFHIMHQV